MLKKLLISLILLPSLIYSDNGNKVELLSDRFQAPSGIVADCVNVVTGNYFLVETDLYNPGPVPIVYQRFYNSGNPGGGMLSGGWNDNYHSYAYCPPRLKTDPTAIRIHDGAGVLEYEGNANTEYSRLSYASDHLKWGVINGFQGTDSARYNVMKRRVYLKRDPLPSVKVSHENGEEWQFKTYSYSPFSAWMLMSQKVGDNQTYQSYQWAKNGLIGHVKFCDSQDLVLGSLKFIRHDSNNELKQLDLSLHDGQWATMLYKKGKIFYVSRPLAAHTAYDWKDNRIVKRMLQVDTHFTEIQYYRLKKQTIGGRKVDLKHRNDRRNGRVAELRAPVGTTAAPISTHRFYYDLKDKNRAKGPISGTCEVRDAYDYKKVYAFNDEQRLTSIEDYTRTGEVYRTEGLGWNWQYLAFSYKYDASNRMSRCRIQFYNSERDISHCIIAGNLTGLCKNPLRGAVLGKYYKGEEIEIPCDRHDVYYKYNDRHLLIEKDDGRQIVHTSYVGNSSQIASEITSDSDGIKERAFYTYDAAGAVIEEIKDDGCTSDVFDLTGVSQRLITRIQPTTVSPVGLPKIVEEFYLDPETQEEVLLTKTINTYDRRGCLLKQDVYDSKNCYAFTREWKYNEHRKVIWEKDPLGRISTYAYDYHDNCRKKTTPTQEEECTYDYSNRLIKRIIRQPVSLTESFTYDYKHNCTSSTDINGNTTHYVYDEFDRLIKKTDPRGCVEEYSYDIDDNQTEVIDGNGNVTRKKYTAYGLPYHIEYPDGTEERYIYQTDGVLAEHIDQNGTRTVYTHDYKKRKTSEEVFSDSGELLLSRYWIYNAYHLLKEIDPEGIVTEYSYDGAGRLVSRRCGDQETLYGYDSLGRQDQTWEKFADGQYRVTIQVFDALDQVVEERIEDQEGNLFSKTLFFYDFDGNLMKRTRLTDNGLETASKEYNALGQVTKMVDPNGNETRFIYTYGRQPTTIEIDPLGRQTRSLFDSQNNLIKEEKLDPLGNLLHSTAFAYDAVGNLQERREHVYTGQTHERTLLTAFEYDQLDRQTAIFEPEGKITWTEYTPTGKVANICKPDGKVIHHQYDALDRLVELFSSDGTVHYRYVYDLNGHVVQTVDEVNQTTLERCFDEYGNMLSESFNGEYSIDYVYDLLGRLVEQILPDGSSIDYNFDAAHLLSVQRGQFIHHYDYDLSGRIKESNSSIAGKAGYQYDLRGAPLSLISDRLSQECVYDSVGNLTSLKHIDPLGEVNCRYSYDHLNQLTSESGFVDHNYQTDSLANRRMRDDSTYRVNDLNQLIDLDGQQFIYDSNGNLETFETGHHCVYDALDRLVEVHTQEHIYLYLYDPFHRRLSRKVVLNGNILSDQKYLYSGEREIGLLEHGEIRELRVLGSDLASDIGSAVLFEIDEVQYAPQHDLRGNVSLLYLENGEFEVNRYSAFGEELFQSSLSPWRFSSKRVDGETGWVYFGRRYYDASWGRWTTADPAWFADGPNLYAYVHHNPLRYLDPDGLSAVEHQEMNRPGTGTQGTFLGGMFWGAANHRTYGVSEVMFGEYQCDNWQSMVGYGIGTGASMALGLATGETEARIGLKALGTAGKGIYRTARWCYSAVRWGKAASEMEETAAKIHRDITPNIGKSGKDVVPGGEVANVANKTGRNRFVPDVNATGSHSVFRRDPINGGTAKYATYKPQTNPRNPNPWEIVKRFDGSNHPHSHFNTHSKEWIDTPHVHDPSKPGGIRYPYIWEVP